MTSVLDRQAKIVEQLKKTEYQTFGGDRNRALLFMGQSLTALPEYYNHVSRMAIMQPLWKEMCEPEDYRELVQNADQACEHAYGAAISGITRMNSLSSRLGLEPFADINPKDRRAVSKFIGEYNNTVYNAGIAADGNMTEAIQTHRELDPRVVDKNLNDLMSTVEQPAEAAPEAELE